MCHSPKHIWLTVLSAVFLSKPSHAHEHQALWFNHQLFQPWKLLSVPHLVFFLKSSRELSCSVFPAGEPGIPDPCSLCCGEAVVPYRVSNTFSLLGTNAGWLQRTSTVQLSCVFCPRAPELPSAAITELFRSTTFAPTTHGRSLLFRLSKNLKKKLLNIRVL